MLPGVAPGLALVPALGLTSPGPEAGRLPGHVAPSEPLAGPGEESPAREPLDRDPGR